MNIAMRLIASYITILIRYTRLKIVIGILIPKVFRTAKLYCYKEMVSTIRMVCVIETIFYFN